MSISPSGRRVVVVLLALGLVVSACSSGDEGAADLAGGGPATTPATVEPEVEPEVAEPSDGFVALDLDAKIADFIADPNSKKGALVAEAMGQSGDPRWGAWLLDIYRLGRSTRIDSRAAEAFAALSGIEAAGTRTEDYRVYGNWVYDERVDPGEGYREWKLAIYGSIDDEFAELLADVPDDLVLAQIQWGGVARGGIPELNQPARLPAAAADWMEDDELVLGAVIDGVAVAYPIRILGHHELANDEIAGVPISMVYCTLCRSGLLFDRRVGDRVLDFQTSGLLIESNKIMVDVQTDTLWRHQTGIGLAGELEGVELDQYPVLTTTWADWIAQHPDTEVLDIPEPIFPDAAATPERPAIAYAYEAGEAYRYYYEDPDVWFPVFDTPDVFEQKEQVIGLSDGDEHLAVQVAGIIERGPQVFSVGERSFAVVPNSVGAFVYDTTGAELPAGPLPDGFVPDVAALRADDGSSWPRIAAPQLFWFAWFGQQPTTETWPG